MAITAGPQQRPAALVEAVEEIMKVYRSLPPRPSVEEVEAAMVVIRSAEGEEQAKMEELGRMEKATDVPEELFHVLRDVRKNIVLLQCYEQKREALHVFELEKRFRAFDELIQRASRLVTGVGGEEEEEVKKEKIGIFLPGGKVERKVLDGFSDKGLVDREKEEKKNFIVSKELPRASSLKSYSLSGGDDEKLSLIKVASLIETSAKKGTAVLDLQGKLMDQIEWLPVSLGKLLDTTEMNLSENRIMALPSTIGSLRFLTKLDIHSNQLINLPDTFGELSSLTDLDLHGNRMKSLPASFGNLTSLTNLNLSSNQLSILPESIGKLTCLRRLDIETNELEELPYTIGSCSSLIELILDFNQLRALPEAIGKLENLEILKAHYNRIKGLPTTMASLTKLKELDVSFNEIESIPESLCFATSLLKLNVGNNFADLRALPRSIGNLEMLEELDISNNQIRVLPDSFSFLSKLSVLRADETPLEVPPRHVIKLGAQAVVQYMTDRVKPKEGATQTTEQKGFWYWFSSLFCACCKDETEGSN